MEKYLLNKRNLLITGLAALALLATTGCQTLKSRIEPVYYHDNRGVYVDDNAREHAAREESLQGKNTPVYATLVNISF